jgi:hypothetical protein
MPEKPRDVSAILFDRKTEKYSFGQQIKDTLTEKGLIVPD